MVSFIQFPPASVPLSRRGMTDKHLVNNDFHQPLTIFEVMKDLRVKDLDDQMQADGPAA